MKRTARIITGTSGFSYPDWVGPVYEPGTKSQDMFAAYASLFSAVEINATYYHIPASRHMALLAEKAPDNFLFTAKLPGLITHQRQDLKINAGYFQKGMAPLRESGKLAVLLAQFPWSFRRSPENETYLRECAEIFRGDIPLVLEFRHMSWFSDEVLKLCRELNLSICSVDVPPINSLFPAKLVQTSPLLYLRFHSRNADLWWKGDGKSRYDYLYSRQELAEWVPRLRDAAARSERIFVFFNNCHLGQAARNAADFLVLMGEESPFFGTLF